ncbi:probable serine/threonine-protein kinase CST [Punica granatum]|uniref:Probable serine/threonine-protein kinase CST n=1 Tax=Punica granatum TaxID=22663 RepID=A0A6P8D868_PUNGR|nr:probable serine/threonine-protein kinase CST [Punica granatum]
MAPDLEEISLCDCPRLSVLIEEVGNKHLTKIKGQASLAFSSTSCCGAKQSRTSEGKSVEGETRQSWNLEGKSVEGSRFTSYGGTWVAIKRLYSGAVLGTEEWKSEVTYIGGLSHPNIVDLLGYRSEGRERILVYKFKENLEQLSTTFMGLTAEDCSRSSQRPGFPTSVGNTSYLQGLQGLKDTVGWCFRMANLAVDESHLTTGVSETYDHAAPEYVATGNFLTVSCTSAPKLRPHCFRQYAFNNSCSAFNRAAN